MKIDTLSIRKYAKGFQSLYQKGSRLSEHILLDFENAKIVMQNPATSTTAEAPMVLSDITDDVTNFFVSLPQFLSLCDEYEELEVTSNKEFISPSDERFKIVNYEDPDFILPDKFSNASLQAISTPDQTFIFEAVDFSNKDGTDGVILYDKKVVSSDRISILEHDALDISYNKINIPTAALALIKSIYAKEYSVGAVDSSFMMISLDDEFKCLFPMSNKDMPPEYYAGTLMSRGFHSNYAEISKSETIEALRFLSPFVKDIINERISFKFENGQFVLFTNGDNKAERKLDVDEYPDVLEGYEFIVSRNLFSKCLKTVHDDFVKIHLEPCLPSDNPNAGLIGLTGKSDNSSSIIMVRLPE